MWTNVSSCGKADVKSHSVLDSSVWLLARSRVSSTAMLTAVVTCTHSQGPPLLSAPYDLLFHHKSPLMVSLTFLQGGAN